MSAQPLRVVDTGTGEVHEGCPSCQLLQDQVKGAERDIRSWRSRCAELERDREQAAKDHEQWPVAVELFKLWKVLTGHTKSRFGAGRFEQILPLLEKYGKDACELAIRGIAFDPWESDRKNGTRERHDGWQTVFRDENSLEKYANKAPRGPAIAR